MTRTATRIAVGPGNGRFISVGQVSSEAATMHRGTCGHAAQWPTRPRFYTAAAAAASAAEVLMLVCITNLVIKY